MVLSEIKITVCVRYELLQKCWSYAAEARPSFRQCLQVVTALRDKTSPNITLTATPSPAPHYLTLLPDGKLYSFSSLHALLLQQPPFIDDRM